MGDGQELFFLPHPTIENGTAGSGHLNSSLLPAYNLSSAAGELAAPSTEDYANILNFQYYVWSVVGTIVAVFGILGNIVSIPVLANRRMMSPTSCYLIALAIFDSLVLISLVMSMSLPIVYLVTGRLKPYYQIYPYLQPVAYPLALTAQTASIYTTVAFTIERYIAVCFPLKAGNWCSMSHARKGIIFTVIASVVYNVPRMFEYQVSVVHNADNSTTAHYMYTELGESTTYRHVYFIYLNIIVMLILPFLVLLVLNVLLIRAVRQSARAEGKVTNRQRRENNLTVMLISVVIVFLLCQVLSIVDNIFLAIMSDAAIQSPPFVKLTCVSSLMVITNSAINFYLYCMFGKKFRRVFLWLFCSCAQKFAARLNLNAADPETTTVMTTSVKHHTLAMVKGGGGSRKCRAGTPLLAAAAATSRQGNNHRQGGSYTNHTHLSPNVMTYTMVTSTNCPNGIISDETSL